MNDMKCPFCGEPIDIDDVHLYYICRNKGCVFCGVGADYKFWQELIRTRKALGVAVDALKWIAYDENDEQDGLEEFAITQMVEKADDAIKEITTLEQKGVK